jgi:hypothetical protein
MSINLRLSTVALICAVVIACLPYDIYEVGLGAIAAIACMRIVEQISSRYGRIAVYILTAIPTAQILVLIRRAICEEGLYTTMRNNPVRFIGGDIAYGFKHAFLTIVQSIAATINYCMDETKMVEIEDLNHRLFVVGWIIIVTSILLVFKPVVAEPKKQKT